MSEAKWPDGDPRLPQGGRADGYCGPRPGAYERHPGGYRDDFALPGDERDWYRDERGARGNDGGTYRDERAGRGAYEDDRDGRADPSRPSAPANRRSRRWGTLPGRNGVSIVVGSAALGALGTAVTGGQPGFLLGFLVVAGTITAVLAVRPQAAYRIIPVPALTYVVAAALAGLVSDRATGTSGTALAINGLQWFAGGFIAMAVATGLAIVLAVARIAASRRAQRGPGRSQRDPGRGQRDPGRSQRDSGRSQQDPGRGQQDPGRSHRDSGRSHRDPGRDRRDPGRGQWDSGRDRRDPGGRPDTGASGGRSPRPTTSRSEQRRIDRDPDSPVPARNPRDGERRYRR